MNRFKKSLYIGCFGFLLSTLIISGCQQESGQEDASSSAETVKTLPKPYSKGPSAPPDVKGPNGPPPESVDELNAPQAVTQLEDAMITLPEDR